MELPHPIREYLVASAVENRSPAYLMVGKDGRLVEWGGEIELYGIEQLRQGELVAERVPFLQNCFPLRDSPIFLACLRTEGGLVADVHLFGGTDGDWVLLLDATKEEIQRRLVQQRRNEQSLLLEQRAGASGAVPTGDISEILAVGLGILALEQSNEGRYSPIGALPGWCRLLGLDVDFKTGRWEPASRFPALEAFLAAASSFWSTEGSGRLKSDPWIETDSSGRRRYLEASALCLNSRKILLIELLGEDYEQRVALLQTARERSLTLEKMVKEVMKAEAILRSLISDRQEPGS